MKSDLLRGLLYLVAQRLRFLFYSRIRYLTFSAGGGQGRASGRCDRNVSRDQGVCVTVCDLDYHERVRSLVSLCVSLSSHDSTLEAREATGVSV